MLGTMLDTENSDDWNSETDDEDFIQGQREKQIQVWSLAHTGLNAVLEGCT